MQGKIDVAGTKEEVLSFMKLLVRIYGKEAKMVDIIKDLEKRKNE